MSNEMNMKLLAMNLIRHIGDKVSKTSRFIDDLSGVSQIIGAKNNEITNSLVEDLKNRGLVKVGHTTKTFSDTLFLHVNLTLDGWEKYEEEKLGGFDGNYGFIAMQFDDDCLETFVRNFVKPAIKRWLNFDLVDLRDEAQAGVIDDIMRVKIRDAKFVIADLTHDNNGAYWEAGYAEGLGKPVIYICEKKKYSKNGTHFDVNHCTTIPWSKDRHNEFCDKLIAVLRKSLQL